jgi:hypothetical protein
MKLTTPTPVIIQSKSDQMVVESYYPNKKGRIYLVCENEYTNYQNGTVSIGFRYYTVENNQFVAQRLPADNPGVAILDIKIVNQFAQTIKATNPNLDLDSMDEYSRRVALLTAGMYLMVHTMEHKPYGLEMNDFESYTDIKIEEDENEA